MCDTQIRILDTKWQTAEWRGEEERWLRRSIIRGQQKRKRGRGDDQKIKSWNYKRLLRAPRATIHQTAQPRVCKMKRNVEKKYISSKSGSPHLKARRCKKDDRKAQRYVLAYEMSGFWTRQVQISFEQAKALRKRLDKAFSWTHRNYKKHEEDENRKNSELMRR